MKDKDSYLDVSAQCTGRVNITCRTHITAMLGRDVFVRLLNQHRINRSVFLSCLWEMMLLCR
jgi:hypothetical protein